MALVALVLAPTLFWLWFFYRKDAIHPEPRGLVAKVFFFGMLATIPAIILEGLGNQVIPFIDSQSILPLFLGTLLIVGPAEEMSKYLVLRWRIWRRPEFDEPIDGIVYAAAVALGFATVENFFYALQDGMAVMLLRGPISTLAHVLFAAPWGYGLGLAKQLPPGEGAAAVRRGLFIASLAHGAFDFFLFTGQTASSWALVIPLAFILLKVMWNVTMSDIKQALQWQPNAPGTPPTSSPSAPSV